MIEKYRKQAPWGRSLGLGLVLWTSKNSAQRTLAWHWHRNRCSARLWWCLSNDAAFTKCPNHGKKTRAGEPSQKFGENCCLNARETQVGAMWRYGTSPKIASEWQLGPRCPTHNIYIYRYTHWIWVETCRTAAPQNFAVHKCARKNVCKMKTFFKRTLSDVFGCHVHRQPKKF